MAMRIDPTPITRFRKRIMEWRHRADSTSGDLTERMASEYQTLVQQFASGRPGPQVVTGAYRASISKRNEGKTWYVYTDAPQAARREFGFVGTDSLGRHYHQGAFPHWRPAMNVLVANMSMFYKAWLTGVLR